VNLARDAVNAGEYRQALQDANRGLAVQPDHALLLCCRAAAYLGLDHGPPALEDLTRASRLGADPTEVERLTAQALYVCERYEDALPLLERAFAREPEDGNLALVTASAAFELGRYARAIELAERTLQLNPGNRDAMTIRTDAAAAMTTDH
jgi:tetratricopeptide (TPR) repeat protein